MTIDKETYNGIVIESHYNKETKFFYATSKIANSSNKFDTKLGNICMGFPTPIEAINNVKEKIDNFFKIAPKTYKELADAITGSLIWTGYEDCYADEEIIKQLVSSFIKTL